METVAAMFHALLADAFSRPPDGDGSGHSFLANLSSVDDSEWDTIPSGLSRSVRDIVLHVGSCKYMYDDFAFRSATMRWDVPPVWPRDADALPITEVRQWLAAGQELLLESAAALDDAALDAPCLTNWGERWPARRILQTMIEHDLYHAGEINHLRSLIQGSDRWAFADD